MLTTRMKKTAAIALLAAGSLSLSARPSEALVGLAFMNPVGIVLGSGLMVTGVAVLGTSAYLGCRGPTHMLSALVCTLSIVGGTALGATAFVPGLLILDSNGNPPQISFSQLSETDAQLLGISSQAAALFNANVSELNSIRESVALDIQEQAQKSGAELNFETLNTQARQTWTEALEAAFDAPSARELQGVVEALSAQLLKPSTSAN